VVTQLQHFTYSFKKKKKKHLGGGFYKEQATARPLEAFWIYFMQ
jgi:hypothetical protein